MVSTVVNLTCQAISAYRRNMAAFILSDNVKPADFQKWFNFAEQLWIVSCSKQTVNSGSSRCDFF